MQAVAHHPWRLGQLGTEKHQGRGPADGHGWGRASRCPLRVALLCSRLAAPNLTDVSAPRCKDSHAEWPLLGHPQQCW